MQELIAVVLVILIINIFLILAIKNISKKFNNHMKQSTLKNLEAYNDIIEAKENKLVELNEQLLKLKSEIKDFEASDKKYISNQLPVTNISLEPNMTIYEDDDFFNNYSFIRNNFKMDYKGIVQNFVFDNIEKDNNLYELYKSLLSKINLDAYYELLKCDEEVRESMLIKILSNREVSILEEYKNINGCFDLVDFYNYIQEKVNLLDPTILIKGNESFKYLEQIDKRIKVQKDNSIIEGMKILYKGKIFDYSL